MKRFHVMLPLEHRAFMRAKLSDSLAIFFVLSIVSDIILFRSEIAAVDIIEIMVCVAIGGSAAYKKLPMKVQPNPDFPDSVY